MLFQKHHPSQKHTRRHRGHSPKPHAQPRPGRRYRRRARRLRRRTLPPLNDTLHDAELIRNLALLERPRSRRQRGIPVRLREKCGCFRVVGDDGRDAKVCGRRGEGFDFRGGGGLGGIVGAAGGFGERSVADARVEEDGCCPCAGLRGGSVEDLENSGGSVPLLHRRRRGLRRWGLEVRCRP